MLQKIKNRYPLLYIRSKNEIAKRISSKKLSKEKALALINDVIENKDKYWHDVMGSSEPEKGKFVRSCKETKLGRLLWLIDRKILAPHDYLIPEFIFGGISEKDHVQAVQYLLGNHKKRSLLRLDVSKFFEQNKYQRVFGFFRYKCGCTTKPAHLLAKLCCVPLGKKNSKTTEESLARGFATSTRLALWCNLDLFIKISWEIRQFLKGKDPRIAIFVDDIGVTASRVSKETMARLSDRIENILNTKSLPHSLPINQIKKQNNIISYLDKNMEHLGLKIGRNKITIGQKTRLKQKELTNKLKNKNLSSSEKNTLIYKKKSYENYKKYIKKINTEN